MTLGTRGTSARRDSRELPGGLSGYPPGRYRLEVNLEAMSFTAPTTRRQNIRKNPAIAANTDASGIKESGPMYTRALSWWGGMDAHPHRAVAGDLPGNAIARSGHDQPFRVPGG